MEYGYLYTSCVIVATISIDGIIKNSYVERFTKLNKKHYIRNQWRNIPYSFVLAGKLLVERHFLFSIFYSFNWIETVVLSFN